MAAYNLVSLVIREKKLGDHVVVYVNGSDVFVREIVCSKREHAIVKGSL